MHVHVYVHTSVCMHVFMYVCVYVMSVQLCPQLGGIGDETTRRPVLTCSSFLYSWSKRCGVISDDTCLSTIQSCTSCVVPRSTARACVGNLYCSLSDPPPLHCVVPPRCNVYGAAHSVRSRPQRSGQLWTHPPPPYRHPGLLPPHRDTHQQW